MTKTRVKSAAVTPPQTLAEAEKVMAIYAKADAELQQINAKMDEEFTAIRERNAIRLQELEEAKKIGFQKVQFFAESNTGLFEKKKSFEMAQGAIGFRTGTPKLKTAKGFTWAAITKLLKDKAAEYLLIKEEPAKAKIIADREKPEVQFLMQTVGIICEQDETFFIELKKEVQNG